jgi:hypothetical protein
MAYDRWLTSTHQLLGVKMGCIQEAALIVDWRVYISQAYVYKLCRPTRWGSLCKTKSIVSAYVQPVNGTGPSRFIPENWNVETVD